MNSSLETMDLAAAIRSGGPKREQALSNLYNVTGLFFKIKQMVTNHGGNEEDARDVFHEGIITLDRKIRQNEYEDRGTIESYLFGVCRFIWSNQQRKNKRVELKEDFTPFDRSSGENPLDTMLNNEGQHLVATLFGQLGENCSKILTLWKLSYSMNEIAEEMGLPSGENARKHKFRCYQKLLGLIDNSPELAINLKNVGQ
ncbi:MAG: RNA polymerase sigma factor [Bacteroidota bacterium]|jgi:RNA polymerase sigma factor (sigma-70 family)